MDVNSFVSLAEELVSRPFPEATADAGGWLEGLTQSGPGAHFAPVAISPSLYETPADDDGTIVDRYDEVYDDFEQRRRQAVAALTTRWGLPQPYSFEAEYERVVGNDESVSMLDYDLAMFTGGEPFSAWRRGDRVVGLLLGQMDKEFPIVLTLAIIGRPSS